MHNNPVINPKGNSYTINRPEIEQMVTTGVNEFRAMGNDSSQINAVTAKAQDILSRFKTIGKEAAEKLNKEFPSGSGSKSENYDLNVRKDEEKRLGDNIRDESKIERPHDFDKLKPFSKTKASFEKQMKKVESLLSVKSIDELSKRKLNFLKARISKGLERIASMESGDWKEEKFKNVDLNTRKDEEKFFKKDDTKEHKSDINDLISRAGIESMKSEKLRKKAYEDMEAEQKKNIEQTITELEKNEEDFEKDIDVLSAHIEKTKTAASEEDEKVEDKKEDKEESEKDDDKEKDKSKDDKKEKGKEKPKETKKDDKSKKVGPDKTKKIDIKEKMKRLREMRDKKKGLDSGKDELSMGDKGTPSLGDETPSMPSAPREKKPMGGPSSFKDDLTAEFNLMPTKIASYWNIKDYAGNTILKFTGADAYGKELFKEFNWFSSQNYGKLLLSKLRDNGLKAIAESVNGEYKITKHAEYIQNKIDKKSNQSVDRNVKTASEDPKSYWTGFFGKGEGKSKEYGNKLSQLFRSQNKKVKAENEELKKKISEIEKKLNAVASQKDDLDNEKILRIKAERALNLASVMADKGHITKENLESVATELTVVDEKSFAMMEDIFNKKMAKVDETKNIKKAFKQVAGLKNIPLIKENQDLKLTFKEKLDNALINPKIAKIQEYYKNRK